MCDLTAALQIHFVNENHWVVSLSMNGVISLYNSGTISDGLAEQLARIYGHLEASIDGRITIHYVPVQKQEGIPNCGLFSITSCYSGSNLEPK